MSKKYKWDSSFDWLEWKLQHDWDENTGYTELKDLVFTFLSSDDIQSAHQEDMDADGYFEPVKRGMSMEDYD